MSPSLINGEYVYEEVYPAFKEGTDEKEKTALLNQAFLTQLQSQGMIFSGEAPLKVADIGCGPCDTLIKYLKGISFLPGFQIRATDFNQDYAGPEGKASRNLREARDSGLLPIKDFSVKAGNAFEEKLTDLLAGPGDSSVKHSFGLTFLSHLLYHAHQRSEIDRILQEVSENLLGPKSLGILYHVAHRSKGTFQYFRDRFGSTALNTHKSDTPTMNVQDPPTAIAESCRRNEIPYMNFEFITHLQFGPLSAEVWEKFQEPESYSELAKRSPGDFEDLKRLYFIVQRSPQEFATDRTSTGLVAYLQEIRDILEKNKGVLLLEETMQVICPRDATPLFSEKVQSLLRQIPSSF